MLWYRLRARQEILNEYEREMNVLTNTPNFRVVAKSIFKWKKPLREGRLQWLGSDVNNLHSASGSMLFRVLISAPMLEANSMGS